MREKLVSEIHKVRVEAYDFLLVPFPIVLMILSDMRSTVMLNF
ncbi:MAG: hypothetical protein ACLS4Z_03590 [Christensenellaceae bacterium]